MVKFGSLRLGTEPAAARPSQTLSLRSATPKVLGLKLHGFASGRPLKPPNVVGVEGCELPASKTKALNERSKDPSYDISISRPPGRLGPCAGPERRGPGPPRVSSGVSTVHFLGDRGTAREGSRRRRVIVSPPSPRGSAMARPSHGLRRPRRLLHYPDGPEGRSLGPRGRAPRRAGRPSGSARRRSYRFGRAARSMDIRGCRERAETKRSSWLAAWARGREVVYAAPVAAPGDERALVKARAPRAPCAQTAARARGADVRGGGCRGARRRMAGDHGRRASAPTASGTRSESCAAVARRLLLRAARLGATRPPRSGRPGRRTGALRLVGRPRRLRRLS